MVAAVDGIRLIVPGGRLGDRITGRPIRCDANPVGLPIAAPLDRVLRRPTESALAFPPALGPSEVVVLNCHACEHFVITGADYGYWKRQEQRWAAMAEGAPDQSAREYIYATFQRSSQALVGLEKALLALGLLDQAKDLDLRSPQQDFFHPIWTQGWRAGDLVQIGGGQTAANQDAPELDQPIHLESRAAS